MVDHPRQAPFSAAPAPDGSSTAPIVTPAGSTIEPERQGGYWVCDRDHHCSHADSLWQAQQLVQWAEVHHRPLDQFGRD
jgi:hypothetical protein